MDDRITPPVNLHRLEVREGTGQNFIFFWQPPQTASKCRQPPRLNDIFRSHLLKVAFKGCYLIYLTAFLFNGLLKLHDTHPNSRWLRHQDICAHLIKNSHHLGPISGSCDGHSSIVRKMVFLFNWAVFRFHVNLTKVYSLEWW